MYLIKIYMFCLELFCYIMLQMYNSVSFKTFVVLTEELYWKGPEGDST